MLISLDDEKKKNHTDAVITLFWMENVKILNFVFTI